MYDKLDKDAGYDSNTKAIAMIELTKVVREHVPIIESGEYGNTFGMILDNVLRDAAMNGDEVQSFTLNMERDDWHNFARSVVNQAIGEPPHKRRK